MSILIDGQAAGIHLLMNASYDFFLKKARVYVMIGFGKPAMAFPQTFNLLFHGGEGHDNTFL